MKDIKSNIVLIFVLFWLPALGLAQQLKTEKFDLNDFLGEREFHSATQANDLIIYFSTSEGILSFDGSDFKKIKLPTKGISTNAIHSFKENLYLSLPESIIKYFPKNDSSIVIAEKNILQFQDINNQLWMITSNELLVWENDILKSVYTAPDNQTINCFSIDDKKTVLGHSQGITLLEKGSKSKSFGSYLKPQKFMKLDSVTYILSGDAIFELNGDNIKRSFKNKNPIIDFYVDDFGKNWFINDDKTLRVYDLNRSSSVKLAEGKTPVKGKTIFQDKENNLWVLGKNKLVKITQSNPFLKLYENDISGVFSGSNNNLIITENNIQFISEIFGNRAIGISNNFTSEADYFAFSAEQNWIITLNGNIYSLYKNGSRFVLLKKNHKYTPLKGINENQFLAKNSDGDIFVLNKDFEPIQKIKGVDRAKKIFSFNEIIYAFSNDQLHRFSDQGKISSSTPISDSIKLENVAVAQNGYWYFTPNSISKIDEEGNISAVDGSSNTTLNKVTILNIFDDLDGNLWIATKDNLLRYPLNATGKELSLQNEASYNNDDFIFSTYFKSAVKDASGRIWFINENGISIYNPLKEIPNLVAPSITVENAFAYEVDNFNNPIDTIYITEDGQKLENNSVLVIEPKVINHYKNQKSSIGFRNVSTNQTERKISSGERIILTDLSDGFNSINLKAYNSNGVESKNDVNINFYVIPPIWKQNWFYITSVVSFLLLGFIGYRTLINIKNNRAQELEDELHKGLEDLEKRSHLQVLKAERLKQLNELITSQKTELEKKNKQIESQKYELSLTNQQIKKQKDLLEETSSKLKSSINYAKRIQNALMSTEIEIKKAMDDSFVYFQPRDSVSGDFFWFNKYKNDNGEELLILAAVDCTGHGVPGAIVSVVGMNLLNNITRLKQTYDPGQILTDMNNDIVADLRQDETQVNDGMDMTIVTYNTVTKQLYFAGAKNPLMYVEDGELIRIKGDKYAIGGQQRGEKRFFQTHQLDLSDNKKRTFYLFSDGYQDQFGGEKGFKYLVGNFKKLLLSIHDKGPLDQKTILHEEIEDWKNGYSQTDDILVIGFKL